MQPIKTASRMIGNFFKEKNDSVIESKLESVVGVEFEDPVFKDIDVRPYIFPMTENIEKRKLRIIPEFRRSESGTSYCSKETFALY